MPVFLLLVAVPIIEIALFIEVGGWLGLWPTIAIVVATAALGTILLRAQGMAALADLQRQMSEGENPGGTLAHGAMILVAGVLLLTPGFFTDAVGFLLLTPPVRTAAIRFAKSRMVHVHAGVHTRGGGSPDIHPEDNGRHPGAATVDGDYEVVDDGAGPAPGAKPGNSGWTQVPDDKQGS